MNERQHAGRELLLVEQDLPDGTCQELGSFKDAPLVGPDQQQLDLVPQTPNPPFDEYGVGFVDSWGQTPIYPGPCR